MQQCFGLVRGWVAGIPLKLQVSVLEMNSSVLCTTRATDTTCAATLRSSSYRQTQRSLALHDEPVAVDPNSKHCRS